MKRDLSNKKEHFSKVEAMLINIQKKKKGDPSK
jgi:hypothetical protein